MTRPEDQQLEEEFARLRSVAALIQAARTLIATRPAFRLRPVGGEGSESRLRQTDEIEAEDVLIAAIKRVEENYAALRAS